jgi:oligoribonuclease NrnB/cAMP/cGMP phosphodiesterase (DHH superfamily)
MCILTHYYKYETLKDLHLLVVVSQYTHETLKDLLVVVSQYTHETLKDLLVVVSHIDSLLQVDL